MRTGKNLFRSQVIFKIMYNMAKTSLGHISKHLDQFMRPSALPRVHKYLVLGVAYISLGDNLTHDIIVQYIAVHYYWRENNSGLYIYIYIDITLL